MESVILDSVAGILGGIHLDVVLRRVEDVCDPNPLEIVHVADSVPVTDDNPLVDLVAVDAEMSPLIVITRRFKSWQWPVLPRPRVDNGVYQLVPRGLPGDGGGLQSQVSNTEKGKYQ